MTIPDRRDNPRITILTSAQVQTLDGKRLEIGREKDEAKRVKLIEAFEIRCLIMAVEADKWIDACRGIALGRRGGDKLTHRRLVEGRDC